MRRRDAAAREGYSGRMPPATPLRIDLEASSGALRPYRFRRRNRHGRGLRGELIPQHLAGSRSRSERFEDWVMESAARLERMWGEQIQSYQFVVSDIPPGLEDLARSGEPVPLGAARPGRSGKPPVITLYRRPIEAAARGLVAVDELVHDVVVEQLATHMNLEPEAVDPGYGRYRPL